MLNNILQYLENTVPRVPDKLAFSTGTEGLTFGELYVHARTIGAGLLARGYAREPVAVLMDKHPHTIATFFGVLYAGCFYAALDGDMPPARMGLILDTLKPRLLICDKKNQKTARANSKPPAPPNTPLNSMAHSPNAPSCASMPHTPSQTTPPGISPK